MTKISVITVKELVIPVNTLVKHYLQLRFILYDYEGSKNRNV